MQSKDGGKKQSYTGLVNPTCLIREGMVTLAGTGKTATSVSQVVCLRPWNSVGTSYRFSDPTKRSTVCLSISANVLGENLILLLSILADWLWDSQLTKCKPHLHGSWSTLALQCIKLRSNNAMIPIIDDVRYAHAGKTCTNVTFRFNKYQLTKSQFPVYIWCIKYAHIC